jgi:type IV pilus assembly protein PilA
VDASGGKIKVLFQSSKASPPINGLTKYLMLSPITSAGSVTWTCALSTLDAKYLPMSCRP